MLCYPPLFCHSSPILSSKNANFSSFECLKTAHWWRWIMVEWMRRERERKELQLHSWRKMKRHDSCSAFCSPIFVSLGNRKKGQGRWGGEAAEVTCHAREFQVEAGWATARWRRAWCGPAQKKNKEKGKKEGEGGKDWSRDSLGQAHVARERRVNGGQMARRLSLKTRLLVGLRLLLCYFLQSDPALAFVAYFPLVFSIPTK